MIYTDLHMHSSFSEDSDTPMEEQIKSSISKGLKYICFTEHMDMDFPENEEGLTFLCDTESYYEKYLECSLKYGDRIKLLFGIEYGLQPHLKEKMREYVSKYPFDMVIGSSHVVNKKDPYYKEYYLGRDEKTAYLEYFESVLENVKIFDDYDVYGHIDYVVRYGPNKNRDYSYREYGDILDEILKRIIEKGKGIEINSAGFAYGLKEPNPSREVLKRYKELGGEIITVGSDAHTSDRVAYSFDKVKELLLSLGYGYYTIFFKRKAEFVKI